METELSSDEVKFVFELQKQLPQVFLPVPLFIWGVKSIHDENTNRLMSVLQVMKDDENFVKATGINESRLGYLLFRAADFALWKRGLLMRFQWVLQLLAVFFLIEILFIWLV